MKNRFVFSLLLLLLLTCSCMEKIAPGVRYEWTYDFYNRACSYLSLTAFQGAYGAFLPIDGEVPVKQLRLCLDITSFTSDMLTSDAEYSPMYYSGYTSSSDKDIEKHIIEYIEKKCQPRYLFGDLMNKSQTPEIRISQRDVQIEYRTDLCSGIQIFADQTLFGKGPGEDLTDYYRLEFYEPDYIFLITKDKEVIKELNRMSVREFLDYAPLVFPRAYLYTGKIPPEVQERSLDVSFTVKISLGDGTVLSGKSPSIRIISGQ